MDWNNTMEYIPPVREGHVIKVYDCDTITIACKVPPEQHLVYRFHVRLRGIDSPEIRGPDKEAAMMARDALSTLIMGTRVTLHDTGRDKYGRLLATVFTADGVNLSEWALQRGFAIPYDGGKKDPGSES